MSLRTALCRESTGADLRRVEAFIKYIEENMPPEKAREALHLLHVAVAPGTVAPLPPAA